MLPSNSSCGIASTTRGSPKPHGFSCSRDLRVSRTSILYPLPRYDFTQCNRNDSASDRCQWVLGVQVDNICIQSPTTFCTCTCMDTNTDLVSYHKKTNNWNKFNLEYQTRSRLIIHQCHRQSIQKKWLSSRCVIIIIFIVKFFDRAGPCVSKIQVF